MRLALFEPEIAGNVGAVMRLGACFGVAVDLIEPMGFAWDDARVRRTAMDYIDHVAVGRHPSFDAFQRSIGSQRLILFTTAADHSPYEFAFNADDILLFGKESGGGNRGGRGGVRCAFEDPDPRRSAVVQPCNLGRDRPG